MTSPAQTQLYFRAWAAAAQAHGWTTRAGIAAALARRQAGESWVSPQLTQSLDTIHLIAADLADRASRSITADDLRHACHWFALGKPKSSTAFSNEDLDRVLALLRLLAQPESIANLIHHETAGQDGKRKRQVHFITRAAAAPYWQSIARAKFGSDDLSALTLPQLTQLALTLRQRMVARESRAASLQPQVAA